MARKNDISSEQKKPGQQMLQLRLLAALSRKSFAEISGLTVEQVKNYERLLVPWRESDLKAALAALTEHLHKALQAIEDLEVKFPRNQPQKSYESEIGSR